MSRIHVPWLLAAPAGMALCAGCAQEVSGISTFVGPGNPVGEFGIPVRSLDEGRFAGVVRQKYDFSCGSAALATLLRYHYDYAVREEVAFRGMWAEGDRDQIRRVGFSLLDMKRWLGSRGIKAEGYKVGLEQVAETGLPGIALISVKNYKHFVVVKGFRGNEVLLGDPSIGITTMDRDQFAEAWNGIYFVLTDDRERARAAFGTDAQWASYTRAPIGGEFSDPVSQQTLMLSAPFYGDIS